MNKKIYYMRYSKIALVFFTLISLSSLSAVAQTEPFANQYFFNQYLANPAFAGLNGNLKISANYRKLSTSIENAPVSQALSADFSINDKNGLGLTILNSKAGFFSQTNIMGTYAYHLPISTEKKLSFGLSAGIRTDDFDALNVHGDPNDPDVTGYIDRDKYFDAEFGIAYTSNSLNIQASFLNLKDLLSTDEESNLVNRNIFFTGVSYKIDFSQKSFPFTLEPKVAYRGIKGLDGIVDVGANITMKGEKVSVYGLYHSSKSFSTGICLKPNSLLSLIGGYSSVSQELKGIAKGGFELGLNLNL